MNFTSLISTQVRGLKEEIDKMKKNLDKERLKVTKLLQSVKKPRKIHSINLVDNNLDFEQRIYFEKHGCRAFGLNDLVMYSEA